MHKTGYFTHPDCRRHDMGRGHPECPQRLDAIEDRLLASRLLGSDQRITTEGVVGPSSRQAVLARVLNTAPSSLCSLR